MAAETPPRGYRASLVRPHDGDTFWVLVDTGFGQRAEPALRLLDVSAPELLGALRLPRHQPGGADATAYTNSWLDLAKVDAGTHRWPLSIAVHMTKPAKTADPEERMTFVRYLATVWRFWDWPQPWGTSPPARSLSLNADVVAFLAQHPEWPSGK